MAQSSATMRVVHVVIGMLGTVAMLGGMFATMPSAYGAEDESGASASAEWKAPQDQDESSARPDEDADAPAPQAPVPQPGAAPAPQARAKADASNDAAKGAGAPASAPQARSGGDVAQKAPWCSGYSDVETYSNGDAGLQWCLVNPAGTTEHVLHVTGVVVSQPALQSRSNAYGYRGLYDGTSVLRTWNMDVAQRVTEVDFDADVQAASVPEIVRGSGLGHMFYSMSAMKRVVGLNRLDTSGVTNMESVFYGCKSLVSLDVSSWDVSNVTSMESMFYGCSSLSSLDVSSWDVSNVTNMDSTFWDCESLSSLDVSNWDVSNVMFMEYMFYGCSSLSSLDVSSWDVSNVIHMEYMFWDCKSLVLLDVSHWDVSGVGYMQEMFADCSSLVLLDVSHWDVSHAVRMDTMFAYCRSLLSLDVSHWDVSNSFLINDIFLGCKSLVSLDVHGWDVSNVMYFDEMFKGCSNLVSLDLSGWNTSNVLDSTYMFADCSNLVSLDLSGWDLPSIQYEDAYAMVGMFDGCDALRSLTLGSVWGEHKRPPTRGVSGLWFEVDETGGKETVKPGAGVGFDALFANRQSSEGVSHQPGDNPVKYVRGVKTTVSYVDGAGEPVPGAAQDVSWRAPNESFSVDDLKVPGWTIEGDASVTVKLSDDAYDQDKRDDGNPVFTVNVVCKQAKAAGSAVPPAAPAFPASPSPAPSVPPAAGVASGGRAPALAASGGLGSGSAPAEYGSRSAFGAARRSRRHRSQCVAWLDSGNGGTLSDYGPNGQVAPGQVRQVSDVCSSQKSAAIGDVDGVRYVTWLPYFLSGAVIGGFALEAVYLMRRRSKDDGSDNDDYGLANGNDGRSHGTGAYRVGRHASDLSDLSADISMAGTFGIGRHARSAESIVY